MTHASGRWNKGSDMKAHKQRGRAKMISSTSSEGVPVIAYRARTLVNDFTNLSRSHRFTDGKEVGVREAHFGAVSKPHSNESWRGEVCLRRHVTTESEYIDSAYQSPLFDTFGRCRLCHRALIGRARASLVTPLPPSSSLPHVSRSPHACPIPKFSVNL